jgi:predicted nucleic-acid-binding protein
MVMIVADTNVWARACLNDDELQAGKARKALEEARTAGGVFVPLIVLAELAWVLRSKWERSRVLATLDSLLQTQGVQVESPGIVREALDACRQPGKAGFADHLVAMVGFKNGAQEVLTFDLKFGKGLNVRTLR